MQILENKKGALDLSDLALSVVILGIVTSIGATVLINIRDTNTDNNTAWNLSDAAATGIGEYGNWYKTIVIVGVAAVILGLIFMAFGRGARTVGTSGY